MLETFSCPFQFNFNSTIFPINSNSIPIPFIIDPKLDAKHIPGKSNDLPPPRPAHCRTSAFPYTKTFHSYQCKFGGSVARFPPLLTLPHQPKNNTAARWHTSLSSTRWENIFFLHVCVCVCVCVCVAKWLALLVLVWVQVLARWLPPFRPPPVLARRCWRRTRCE